jgi:hypothetical protein
MNLSQKNLIIFIVVVLVLVAAGIWIGMNLGNSGTSGYSAVYLTTGDVYFGNFSWFPTPHISGAWYIQRGVDKNNNPTAAIVPFKNIAWGPSDTIFLDSKQIVLWTKLASDSNLAKAMANPELLNQNQGQIPVPATSTQSR